MIGAHLNWLCGNYLPCRTKFSRSCNKIYFPTLFNNYRYLSSILGSVYLRLNGLKLLEQELQNLVFNINWNLCKFAVNCLKKRNKTRKRGWRKRKTIQMPWKKNWIEKISSWWIILENCLGKEQIFLAGLQPSRCTFKPIETGFMLLKNKGYT